MKSLKVVVITGAAGFLGSNLTRKFLDEGYNVIGIDNFSTGLESNVERLKNSSNFIFVEADVCNFEEWAPVVHSFTNEIEFIFHLASPASPPHYQRLSLETIFVNTVGLKNCLHLADIMGGRVIFSSTSEIYGDPLIHPQPESYWGNVNSYGERSCYDESKRLGEAIIFSWNKRNNTKHGLVRIFNTYGPGMNPNDGRVIVNLLQQAINGETLTIYGDGKQTRSFCYVDDLVEGLILYAESGVTEPINLGNQNEFSLLELVDVLKDMFPKKNLQVKHYPLPADDPKKRRPDCTRAFTKLEWFAKTQLRDGLTKYMGSFK